MANENLAIENNRLVNYLSLNIILSGLLLLVWLSNLVFNFTTYGLFFFVAGMLFFVFCIDLYIRIKRIRKLIKTK